MTGYSVTRTASTGHSGQLVADPLTVDLFKDQRFVATGAHVLLRDGIVIGYNTNQFHRLNSVPCSPGAYAIHLATGAEELDRSFTILVVKLGGVMTNDDLDGGLN